MTKAIVFGGSGFLGSYVIDELIAREINVVNADIKASDYAMGKQCFTKVDILDSRQVNSVITKDVDYVYNFAGLADINIALDEPKATAELNILGNMNILEACRQSKVKRFIYASSAYAQSSKGSFYGISKLSAEKFAEEYQKQYQLDFTILRYGSLYGERADEHNGIYRLLIQALKSHKIIHIGNGEEMREYIHCRDAARLSVDILHKQYANRHLVLTGVEKLKYKDLLTMIKEIFNDQIDVIYKKGDHPGHYMVTPYSFKPLVGEKIVNNPYIDLGQGLLECITELHQALEKDKG